MAAVAPLDAWEHGPHACMPVQLWTNGLCNQCCPLRSKPAPPSPLPPPLQQTVTVPWMPRSCSAHWPWATCSTASPMQPRWGCVWEWPGGAWGSCLAISPRQSVEDLGLLLPPPSPEVPKLTLVAYPLYSLCPSPPLPLPVPFADDPSIRYQGLALAELG